MRIAVYGTGGVGGYFGGRLAQAGESVVFVARGEHLAAIRSEGLRVESVAGDFRVQPAEATDDPAAAGPADLVIVGVKAWQVPDAASAVLPLLHEATVVMPLQNGVEAPDQLAAVVGERRVVPGLCRLVSYVAAPGWIRHAGVPPRIEFGERDGSRTPRVAALLAAFEKCQGVSAAVPPDILAALWEKFLFIAPFSGVGAVARRPAGALRGVPETRALLEAAMREAWELARARGVKVREDAVERTMGFVDALPADATASMQRDIVEGRPSELHSQIGAVVRLGRAAGIATPANDFLYASLLPQELAARGQTLTAGSPPVPPDRSR
jgi:2-dehydropantoate 2-reductase